MKTTEFNPTGPKVPTWFLWLLAVLVALLAFWIAPALPSQAVRLGRVDTVDVVEINTFGRVLDGAERVDWRVAVLYREPDGSLRDYRWFSSPNQIPRALGDGRYVAVWEDGGKLRTVYCRAVRFSRTDVDKELEERKLLPEHKRRKLAE